MRILSKPKKSSSANRSMNAHLSKAAYQSDPEAYMRSKGYDVKVDKALSSKDWTTFVDSNGKATVAYRGTKPSNWRDVTTDVLVGLGLEKFGSRFKRADKAAKLAKEKYGDVSLTGHSLGGSLAMYAGKKQDIESTVFNPGAPKPWYSSDKTSIYMKYGDPVSNISFVSPLLRNLMQGKVHAEVPTGAIFNPINNHGIDQFIQQDMRSLVKKPASTSPVSQENKNIGYTAS